MASEEKQIDFIEEKYERVPDYPQYKVIRVVVILFAILFIIGLITVQEVATGVGYIVFFSVVLFIIAVFLDAHWIQGKRKCPRCGQNMVYFQPDALDEVTTHKHVCLECKVYIDTKQANVMDAG